MIALLALGVGAVIAGGVLHRADHVPAMLVPQDVPADVRGELDATWERFLDAFDGRRRCIGDVTVVLVRDVAAGDARYLPDTARIEIQIPTSPRRFRDSLAHELAHHVEHSCEEFTALQTALHARFGGPERPWRDGDAWGDVPAERWAESVVQIVTGERVRYGRRMPLDDVAVELVVDWGRGRDVAG